MYILTVGERTVFQRAIDDYLISAVGKLLELPMRHAKTPERAIVGGPVWYEVWCVRQRKDVLFELVQR